MSTDLDNEDKKKLVSDRLLKRDQDRLSNLQSKRSERQDKIVDDETLDTFKPIFSRLKNEISNEIQLLDTISKDEKPIKIETISNNIQNLQILLSEATKYLTTFHIEKFGEDIAGLRSAIDSKYITEQKQKKFNFKQVRKKTTEESKPKLVTKPSTVSKVLSNFDSERTILISNLTDETLTHNSNVDQMEIVISNLVNCTIYIKGNPSTVHIDDLINTNLFIGPVSGSVFVNSVTNCKLHVACHQLRIHKSMKTDFYIHVTTKAIIEDCKEVKFARYLWKYDSYCSDFVSSRLNKEINNWSKIDDFNWLVADVPSPNWSIIDE